MIISKYASNNNKNGNKYGALYQTQYCAHTHKYFIYYSKYIITKLFTQNDNIVYNIFWIIKVNSELKPKIIELLLIN